ncbi:MAG: hypothetical protein KGJ59_08315 [Bacteroidota bacterium]|nr:hypothetical protein [Bacteroidota bacterium]
MKTRGIVLLFTAASLEFYTSVFAGGRLFTGNARVDVLSVSPKDFLSEQQPDTSMHAVAMQKIGGEEKSSLLAGAMSFVVPGSGEFYSGSYLKSGIFFTVEVAAIATAILYNNKGDSKTSQFEAYANAHWSAVRYAQWIEQYGASQYGPQLTQAMDYTAIANHDFSQINAWESGTHSEGFSHQLPSYGEQQYYELIGKYRQYKFGWDTYPQDANGVPVSDNGNYDGMIPQQMLNYSADRGKANDYYYASALAVGVVVVNHVLSALDAALTANSHNRTLETSMGMRLQKIDESRSEFVPEFHLSLNF